MAVKTVRAQINGAWVTLTKNQSTGKYEGTVAAPNITSYNVNSGHYYPVTIEATDMANNVTKVNDSHSTLGEKLKLFVKEVTKPTITITAPASSSYLSNNTPAITFQLRDESNGSGVKISSLTIKLDSTTLTNTSPGVSITNVSGGYNVTYTPQVGLSDGPHTVTINVQDNDGNAAVAATRTFTIDTVPPVLNISSPSEDLTYTNVAPLTVVGVTNDITSSSVTIKIKHNNVDQGTITVDGSGNFSKELTLAVGENTISITATDLAGKVTTIDRTVIYDKIPPTINSIVITPNPINVGQSYKITVEVTDE